MIFKITYFGAIKEFIYDNDKKYRQRNAKVCFRTTKKKIKRAESIFATKILKQINIYLISKTNYKLV